MPLSLETLHAPGKTPVSTVFRSIAALKGKMVSKDTVPALLMFVFMTKPQSLFPPEVSSTLVLVSLRYMDTALLTLCTSTGA